MRRLLIATALLAACALASAQAAPAPAPAQPPIPAIVLQHVQAYITAVNAGDMPAAQAFRDRDSAESANKIVTAQVFLNYFVNQRRVTGGVDLMEARAKPGHPDQVEAMLRDRIYGGRHGVVFTLEDAPEHRITLLDPGAAPDWATPPAGPALSPTQVGAQAKSLVDRGCKAGVFSGAVLVARGDTVLMQTACGEANRRFHVANRIDTRINLGSINKMFTAVAVMQLVEAGKVHLDDPLSQYADETWLPKSVSSQVTIAELLSHTSGLGDYLSDGYDKVPRRSYRQLSDYKTLVHTETLAFAPGSQFAYSNTGMLMLGVVIEAASGETYPDYIRRHVYAPSGMTATDTFDADDPQPNIAMGYSWTPGDTPEWRENSFRIEYHGTPAGGGYSTVSDLFRFARALQTDRLVSPASRQYLWSDHPPHDYGAGFEIRQTAAGKVVGHTGFFRGVSSRVSLFLDKGYVVIVLSNVEVGAPTLMDVLGDVVARAR